MTTYSDMQLDALGELANIGSGTAATALSAPHLGAEDFAAARELNRQMQQLDIATEPEEFTRLNQQFHEVLFNKCPNSRLM